MLSVKPDERFNSFQSDETTRSKWSARIQIYQSGPSLVRPCLHELLQQMLSLMDGARIDYYFKKMLISRLLITDRHMAEASPDLDEKSRRESIERADVPFWLLDCVLPGHKPVEKWSQSEFHDGSEKLEVVLPPSPIPYLLVVVPADASTQGYFFLEVRCGQLYEIAYLTWPDMKSHMIGCRE